MTDVERLQLLEERYAHLQRHVEEQDKAVLTLTEELARVKKEIAALRAQLAAQSTGEESPSDERPPHY